jgi:tRNA nucleotidyltransferase (CCA-adding enzyme)
MAMLRFLPKRSELLERIRGLPAAQPLFERLPRRPPVHLVGGAVRDILLGGVPYDLDLVVEGDAAAFAASLGGTLRLHDRFGTSTVMFDGFSYDIARARRETYARPGALPDVAAASLADDLYRRDFTVNAIAVALTGATPGEVTAEPRALEDLEARRLRVLHDRSFDDDPTRLLRLARYAARLGFAVEAHTRTLVEAAIESGALGTVSGSRLGAELRLLAREEDPIRALLALRELGLDRPLHRDLGLHDGALARRALALLPRGERRDRLAIAVATRDVPAIDLPPLLDWLAFEAEDREVIAATASRASDLARALAASQTPSAIAAAAAGAPPELVALAGALGPERQARDWLERLRHVRLAIDGHDLITAGVRQGPDVGRGLRAALAAKLDGRTDTREDELAEALNAAGEPQ